MFFLRKYYKEVFISLFFLILTLIATYPVVFKMNTSVYGPLYGTDMRGGIWDFWWFKYSWQHKLPYNPISVVAYPFGIEAPDYPPISGFIFKWLAILTNEIFTYNFVLILSFLLSALFTYWLVFSLTKNRIASVISGLIFSFCPYHFNRTWEHLGLAQTQWIPLYVLSLIKLKQMPNFKNSLFTALSFTLVLSFDFYYAYIMSVFTIGFIVFMAIYKWKDKIKSNVNYQLALDLKIILMIFLALGIAAIMNTPMIYPILKAAFFTPKSNLATTDAYMRSFNYLFSQSARPLSYLLPASVHPIFGPFTKSMFGSIFYGRGSIEQTLYLGWCPLILSFIAFRRWKKIRSKTLIFNHEENFYIEFSIFSGILFFLFSLPPYFNFLFFKIYFPSFFMYKFLPMFRAYARFGVVVMLSVSVLSGFGLKFILEKIKSLKKRIAFISAITCIILFEFINMPPFHVTDLSQPPAVYRWFSQQPGDFVIAEYPMGKAFLGEAHMDYDFIFYQRIHQKKLINGARLGTNAYEIKEKISRLTDVSTPGILKYLGAEYLVIHLNKYRESKEDVDIIGEAPDFTKQKWLKLVKKFDDAEVYKITAEPINPSFIKINEK